MDAHQQKISPVHARRAAFLVYNLPDLTVLASPFARTDDCYHDRNPCPTDIWGMTNQFSRIQWRSLLSRCVLFFVPERHSFRRAASRIVLDLQPEGFMS